MKAIEHTESQDSFIDMLLTIHRPVVRIESMENKYSYWAVRTFDRPLVKEGIECLYLEGYEITEYMSQTDIHTIHKQNFQQMIDQMIDKMMLKKMTLSLHHKWIYYGT